MKLDTLFALQALLVLLILALTQKAFADGKELITEQTWTPPEITLKSPGTHPVITATPDELKRLQSAWKTPGPAHDILAERFAKADAAIKDGITFPPEGGQHNQWYQCEKCQVALKTIDAHHHQCPKCGTVYSGFPYDNVLYSHQHDFNIYRGEDSAWAYAATGDKKYADFTAQILLGYADRYLKYPMVSNNVNDKSVDVAAEKLTKYKSAGHIYEQTLGEAMMLIPLSKSYDLIYNSGSLTDNQKKHVETQLLRPMAECIDVYRAGKSNWQTWHNAALLYAGAVMGDQAMVKQSILEPKNGFVFQMHESVSPEGMWYENSWGYHYYTLVALTHMAEGTRHLGIDLYANPLLKKMYLLAFDYRMSDGSLPRFGDAVQDNLQRPSVNEFAYAIYKDPRLLPTLPTKPSFDSITLGRDPVAQPPSIPPAQSKLFPGAGNAVLLTDGPGKLSAAITFAPYGGFHGHFDKNSFVFFGYDQELGVDPGRAASQAYRLPIHKDWYKATTGHNDILVDGLGQKEADGKLLSFAANNQYAAVAADAGPAFDGIDHKRFLVLAPNYLLVVDELQPTDGKEHTFDFIYHNKGSAVTTTLPESKQQLGIAQGYEYFQDVKPYQGKDGLVQLTIQGEKVDTHLTLRGQTGDEIFTATGPLKSVDDRVPVVIVRRRGKIGRFETVIEPVLKGQPSSIKDFTTLYIQDGHYEASLISRKEGHEEIRSGRPFGEKITVVVTGEGRIADQVLTTKTP